MSTVNPDGKTPTMIEPATNNDPIFIDEKIAAAKTGLSVSYLQRARVERIGPKYHRVGRRVVYKLVELVEWIESGKAATETLSTPTSRKVSK